MQLSIKNIGKLSNAEIDLRGITVIAGENNTGKSTVGKALYMASQCLNSANVNYFYKYKSQKIAESLVFGSYTTLSLTMLTASIYSILSSQPNLTTEKFFSALYAATDDISFKTYDMNNSSLKSLIELNQLTYLNSRIKFYHTSLFCDQLRSLYQTDNEYFIKLSEEGEEFSINLSRQFTEVPKSLLCISTHYIDDPFALDLFPSRMHNIPASRRILYPDLNDAVHTLLNETEDDYITRDILTQRLGETYTKLNNLVNGKLVKESNLACFQTKDLIDAIKISNLSAGFKSLLILKLLLDSNQIQDGDILILDEPEIHLHPEWQLKYAEILVDLQEKLNLKIVITSHSPAFIRFIETYSYIKERMQYLTVYHTIEDKQTPGMYKLLDLTNSEYGLSEEYEKLSAPYAFTDDLIAEYERTHYDT